MKICVAQVKLVKGDIQRNIENHKKLVDLAISCGADTIVFPELSITGYEPELAKELATTADDSRFDDFQEISDTRNVMIGIGVPLRNKAGITISMVIFHPHKGRQTYSKKYIHADEEGFFISGSNDTVLLGQTNIALAICYELSIPEHSVHAYESGGRIYLASVAKTAAGVEKAGKSLADIARKYSMIVLMANCIGHCDNFESGGKTAVWNADGVLAGQLNDVEEGILMIDTGTQEITEKYFS
jgi:predicted amidohydrolase